MQEKTIAEALVAQWSKDYRGFLKDGGGSANAVHPSARAALVERITQMLVQQGEALRESPIAALIEAHKDNPATKYRVRVGPTEYPDIPDDGIEITSSGKIKQKRPRKAKTPIE